jgi:precorrin-6A/cobalt-precorrin-6A reductase
VRVLILGGTGEARALALALDERRDVEVVSSLAGRVRNPALPVGAVRVGGFGGPDGLADYLLAGRFDALVDATHPFAATITAHAVEACRRSGVRGVVLARPEWAPQPGDDWTRVPDVASAAEVCAAAPDGCVFVTTGRRDLAAFAHDVRHTHLVRTVDAPEPPLPPATTLVLDRGPYTVAGETELMRTHGVVVLATKNSGGPMTAAKLTAARDLALPVVMVERPALPAGAVCVHTVDAALAWLDRHGEAPT